MCNNNDFFYQCDPKYQGKYNIPPSWWSRAWEYQFCLNNTCGNGVVMNAGAGYEYRPLTDMLTEKESLVIQVDRSPKIRDVPVKDRHNSATFVADITRPGDFAKSAYDRIFCVSVIDDTMDIGAALNTFRNSIKDDGIIILTFDVPYIENPAWPGTNLDKFCQTVIESDLTFVGEAIRTVDDSRHPVRHVEFGLLCYHCILKRANR